MVNSRAHGSQEAHRRQASTTLSDENCLQHFSLSVVRSLCIVQSETHLWHLPLLFLLSSLRRLLLWEHLSGLVGCELVGCGLVGSGLVGCGLVGSGLVGCVDWLAVWIGWLYGLVGCVDWLVVNWLVVDWLVLDWLVVDWLVLDWLVVDWLAVWIGWLYGLVGCVDWLVDMNFITF